MADLTALLRWICLFLFLAVSGAASGWDIAPSPDVQALVVFKVKYLINSSALSSWNELDPSPCQWRGVACDATSGRVSTLILDGLSLSGRISTTLAQLTGLNTLSLAYNNLFGSFPDEIAQLPTLRRLNISYNALSGPLPKLFGSSGSIEHLDFSFNAFTGQIPAELFSSNRNLRSVALSKNKLHGSIPSSFYSCYLLHSVNFSSNQFSGALSEHIGQLRSLRALDMSRNAIAGGIPLQISSLFHLSDLKLTGNYLSGQIPAGLSNCVNLQVLDLSFNDLSGSFPSPLQSLTNLQVLNLRRNYLSGNIPSWISSLTALQDLDLSENMFSGWLPSSLGLLHNLRRLDISRNSLTGSIPDGFAHLHLSTLNLSNNQLALPIPAGLVTRSLQYLSLSRNQLSGTILSLGDCQSLQVLDLSTNMLTGSLPADFGSCSSLSELNVSGNAFQFSLPSSFGSLEHLQALDISHNLLNSSIPRNLCKGNRLSSLQAHHNFLHGFLPADLGECIWLEDLSFSANHLIGMIPGALGKLMRLKFMDLSQNQLSGNIPPQLGYLKNLAMINVSSNRLSGRIPNGRVFGSMNSSAFAGNSGLCGAIIRVPCAQLQPAPADSPLVSGIPTLASPPHRSEQRVFFSVSAIIAICAAAAVAVAAILVTTGSLRAQKGNRSRTIRMRSMPDASDRVLAVGKLVLFSRARWFRSGNWSPEQHLLLNKDCEIGCGGFGVVYRAVLPDGQSAAVKKLTITGSVKSRDEFEREVQLLGKVRHQNLVSLKGYYWTKQLQILLYDYVSGGDLCTRLHDRGHGHPALDWSTRFKIAKGIAMGLAHLHNCDPQIIHYNVRSSNILLDVGNVPKVSDCGLAKLVPMVNTYSLSQGELGFRAPEFASDNEQINEKCDVYGYGVILLELVTGRRAVEYVANEVVILCECVATMLDEDRALDCVDPDLNLQLQEKGNCLPFLKLALICTSQSPVTRPSMVQVVEMLKLIDPIYS